MSQKQYPKATISFSGHEDLLEIAYARAAQDDRSLAYYIRRLIREDVEKSGLLLRDASSTKLQAEVDKKVDAVNYKIRRQRKPVS